MNLKWMNKEEIDSGSCITTTIQRHRCKVHLRCLSDMKALILEIQG